MLMFVCVSIKGGIFPHLPEGAQCAGRGGAGGVITQGRRLPACTGVRLRDSGLVWQPCRTSGHRRGQKVISIVVIIHQAGVHECSHPQTGEGLARGLEFLLPANSSETPIVHGVKSFPLLMFCCDRFIIMFQPYLKVGISTDYGWLQHLTFLCFQTGLVLWNTQDSASARDNGSQKA